jgi:hypothetical protein
VRQVFTAFQNKSALEADALQLWLVALRNASVIGVTPGRPDLLDLFPFAMQCLSENLDIMGTTVLIVESYLLLNAPAIMAVSDLSRQVVNFER